MTSDMKFTDTLGAISDEWGWRHFGMHLTAKNVVCCICDADVAYSGRITNMILHLRKHHQIDLQGICDVGSFSLALRR